jgi:hypothetical protein
MTYETLKTCQNTPFAKWWPLLNKELAERGENESVFGEAHGCWEIGLGPSLAAIEIIIVRELRGEDRQSFDRFEQARSVGVAEFKAQWTPQDFAAFAALCKERDI